MALQKREKKAFIDENEVRFAFENTGDVAEGYYLGKETFTANGDDLTKVKIRLNETDTKYISFLANTVLQDLIEEGDIGSWVKVTYLGKKTSKKGRQYQDFDYAVDAEKRINVA